MAKDEFRIAKVSYDGDPQEIIRERLTPKALEKLAEMLDSAEMRLVEKAVEKVIRIDRRLQPEPGTNQTLVLNVPPEQLSGMLDGVRAMLGGGDVETGQVRKLTDATTHSDGTA